MFKYQTVIEWTAEQKLEGQILRDLVRTLIMDVEDVTRGDATDYTVDTKELV